jgi:hypothetical protein
MYLARFSYDVAPANREQALKSMHQELDAARKRIFAELTGFAMAISWSLLQPSEQRPSR